MSDVIISPRMSLPVPIASQDPGPDWANNYNSCLSILDGHNHASGSGVQITQDGISLTPAATTFNSLSFSNSNAYGLRSARFTSQSSALALVTDLGCLYESGVDLYYNDGSGNQIRLTQGGSIVGTSGSITGLPSGTASAAYSGGTFVWQSATSTAANMDAGSYILRNATASSKGLTLAPPNAMASDYSLVLPALPGSTKIMALDTSGNITAPYSVDNTTIAISSNLLTLANSAVTATKRGGLGQQLSSSCGNFSTTSTTAVDVTNLTVTITTYGSPVFLFLAPEGTTSTSFVGCTLNTPPNTGIGATFQILNTTNSTQPVTVFCQLGGASGTLFISYPPGSVCGVEAVSAGTYTYKVQTYVGSVIATAQLVRCKLLAYSP